VNEQVEPRQGVGGLELEGHSHIVKDALVCHMAMDYNQAGFGTSVVHRVPEQVEETGDLLFVLQAMAIVDVQIATVHDEK